jgi:dihydroxy-acid dehydratase
VQMELKSMLDLGVMTVSGKTLGENLAELEKEGFFGRGEGYLANYQLRPRDVIRPADQPKGVGSIAVLTGNIAPEGAVVKYSAVRPDMLTHTGPAVVFNREEDVLKAIHQDSVEPGSVLVLRYEGPRGSGMPEILATTEALVTHPRLQNTAVVTDGRFSGATRGPCIGHVSPEAIAGGPIALLEDGDTITIDIPARLLALTGRGSEPLSENQVQALFAERRKNWRPPPHRHPRGILTRYAAHAVSAMKGAYLK